VRIPLRLSSRTFFLLFGGIFLVAGSTLIYEGLNAAVLERAYVEQGEAVQAVVLGKSIQRASRDGNPSTRYEITYRYATPQGPTEGVAGVSVEEWEALEPGSPFRITYLRGAPDASRAEGAGGMTESLVMMGAGTLAALFGGIVLGHSALGIWRERRLLRRGLAAQGTVLAIEPSNVAVNRVRQWRVRYRYQDHLGRPHEGTSDAISPDEAHAVAVGDVVSIRFDRNQSGESVWDRTRTAGGTATPRARAIGALKRLGTGVATIVALIVLMALGELILGLGGLEQMIVRHETPLLVVTIGMAAVGFTLFMGSIVLRIFGGEGEPMTASEIEDLSRSVRMEARPVFGRVTRYRFRGRSAGSSFSERFSLREAKDAWRRRAWRTSPRWRSNFVVMLGVTLLALGLFGTFIVIGPNGVRLLCAVALVYAAVRTIVAVIRA
jgi:hypothetical protein